jgi:hypothetical protein
MELKRDGWKAHVRRQSIYLKSGDRSFLFSSLLVGVLLVFCWFYDGLAMTSNIRACIALARREWIAVLDE